MRRCAGDADRQPNVANHDLGKAYLFQRGHYA